MIGRVVLPPVLGIALSIILFVGMQKMIAPSDPSAKVASEDIALNFLMVKADSETQTKTFKLPEPPQPDEPPPDKPSTDVSQDKIVAQQLPSLSMPSVDLLGDGVAMPSFSGAQVQSGFGDGDAIPVVRVDPVYPQRARRRKISGKVVIKFDINTDGTVKNVIVLESEPKGIFEREATRAAYRWKFKPRIVDGKAVIQTATQAFEFKLNK